MFEPAYLVALSAMLLAGVSALTLIHVVKHFDSPAAAASPQHVPVGAEVVESLPVAAVGKAAPLAG